MLPKNRPPTHPGEMLLKEFIEPMGLTQKAFAKHLNAMKSHKTITNIVDKAA